MRVAGFLNQKLKFVLISTILLLSFFLLFIAFEWSLADDGHTHRFERTHVEAALLPPSWWPIDSEYKAQMSKLNTSGAWHSLLGTDQLGRDLFARCVVGGAISLGIGLFAAFIAVCLGATWGAIAGIKGGKVDVVMMRIVDILYGLPSIMLVVLISIAASSFISTSQSIPQSVKEFINVLALLVAIGTVSWLTVARVIRGQVKSIIARPSIDACKILGIPPWRTLVHHILPALFGPILVYATLTIPAAMLSEAFLSFLGIGVREPLPSWGNLVASGLSQLNPVHSRWWLLLWPCLCIAFTLVTLNWLGQLIQMHVNPKLKDEA